MEFSFFLDISQETFNFSTAKAGKLMLFMEVIAIYSQNIRIS
jgi:hypothetical protein